jgi:hypothetical protein
MQFNEGNRGGPQTSTEKVQSLGKEILWSRKLGKGLSQS